jgi:hypothetical protein
MTNNITPQARYTAIYRNGGTENFSWHRVGPTTREIANADAEAIRRGGRRAYVMEYAMSLAIGLPETFEPGQAFYAL